VTYSPLGTPGTPAGLDDQSSQTGGTASTAKNEAKDVGREAVGGAQQVAGTAKDQAANVADEAKFQAKDLIGQARDEARQQTHQQQQRAAQGLRTAADSLSSMAQNADSGVAQQVVQNVSERAHSAASWLEQREPADLLDEVRRYAARRPGVFIAIAVGAGVLAGRLTKGLIAEAKSNSGASGTDTYGTTGYGATGTYSGTGTYGTTGAADTVLPAYEPVEPSYGSTTAGSRHVAGPLGDDVIEGEDALGDAEPTTTYPQYGQNLGTDRI
jgi:F0F1-type ATP synthase membrane subunit b/b'